MIKKIETFAEHGIEVGKDISFIEAAALVREDMIGHGRHFFESVKDEEVETIYGDDVIERARKAALRKAQSAQTQPKVPSKAPLPRKVPGKGLTPAELRARTDRRMGQ
jgi:hypothetical protein